jgi:hypothetical protein
VVFDVDPIITKTAEVSDEDEQFEALLDQLGVRHLVAGNDDALRAMWENLNADPNPEMMAAFEEVLARLTGDLARKSAEQEDLELSIKNRNKTQEVHLQHLYEEMEQQIQKERKTIRAEEELKEQKTRRELQAVLEIKDSQLQNLLEKQKTLQDQLETVKEQVPEIREENIHLGNEKFKLEQEVERQRLQMLELQDQLDSLRSQTQSERRSRASAAFKVSENIVMEREDIVKELALLRTINSKMLDDQDSSLNQQQQPDRKLTLPVNPCYAQWRSLEQGGGTDDDIGQDILRDSLQKCMSLKPLSPKEEKAILMECGGEDLRRLRQMKPMLQNGIMDNDSEIEYDDNHLELQVNNHKPLTSTSLSYPLQHKRRRHKAIRQPSADNVSLFEELAGSIEEDDDLLLPELPDFEDDEVEDDDTTSSQDHMPLSRNRTSRHKRNHRHSYKSSLLIYTANNKNKPVEESLTSCTGPMSYNGETSADFSSLTTKTDISSFQPPIFGTRSRKPGDDTNVPEQHYNHDSYSKESVAVTPERVFKVIFVGDTSVGKSSLIHRFCRNRFNLRGSSSTVGVDFQTRSMMVDQTSVCLQFWDTAGQERYRCVLVHCNIN